MELRSIYRTYRPQKWSEVVGQDLIVRTLTNEIAHETLVHAYLFTGMRGVGKTTTARLLAKTVNCEKRKKGEVEPCNRCDSCTAITDGRSLDVMEIDAASHTGVDNVRENIIAASRVAPLAQKVRVFIIDEVHMLSIFAFNALLKTLEEPSANVLFILATTDIDRVPETIISRCQRFDFRRVIEKDAEKRLTALARAEGVTVDEQVLITLIRHAEGSLRDAESSLGQLLGLGKKKITMDDAALILPHGDSVRAGALVEHLLRHESVEALALLDDFVDRGGDVIVFIDDCIRHVRTKLLHAVHAGARERGGEVPEALAHILRCFLGASKDAAIAQPPCLALELLVAEYGGGSGAVLKEEQPPTEKKSAHAESSANPVTPSPSSSSALRPRLPGSNGVKKDGEKKEEAVKSGALSLAQIQQRWQDVLAAAKKYNHSLALILKVATPVSIQENALMLAFRYSFHADRLDDTATKTTACRVLQEIFSCPLEVQTTVVAHVTQEKDGTRTEKQLHAQVTPTLLSDLLSTFGGKVVKKAT